MTTSIPFDWPDFLKSWSDEVLGILRHLDSSDNLIEVEALERGSLAYPGATAQEINDLSSRLGTELPTSYVEFLKASNGWMQIGMDAEAGRLWSTTDVKWLRDQDSRLIQQWTKNSLGQASGVEVSDEEYFVYGADQDCINIRVSYLTDMLAISQWVDSAIYLLNPMIKTPAGEWEAWFLGDALPGAYRYRSFQEMLIQHRQSIVEALRENLDD